MRVYFYGPETNISKYQEAYQDIIKEFSQAGFQVVSKTESDFVSKIKEDTLEQIQASGESVLNHVDGIVLEATTADPEIGYLLAFAVLQKKPILCLYQKGAQIKQTLSHLGKIPPFLMVKPYQPKELEKIIEQYTKLFGIDPEQSEIPNIKFTLRISPKISNYLHWKTHNTKKSKADFLRELIQEVIEKDEKYQRQKPKGKNK